MEVEGTPNILSEVLQEIEPIGEHLEGTWRGLGSAVLEAEAGRLRERLLDIAGRYVAINEILGEQHE